jgi:hypothetical protein
MHMQFVLLAHDATCYRIMLCTFNTAVYCAMHLVSELSLDRSGCYIDCTMLRSEGCLELHEDNQVCCHSSDNLNETEIWYAKHTHEDLCSKSVGSVYISIEVGLTKSHIFSHIKVKFNLEQATKTQRGSRVITTRSLPSALNRVGGQHPPPSLPLGKTRYPLCRRLGGPQSRSGQVRKIWPPPGFDPRTVQSVVSRYTGSLFSHMTNWYFWT